MSSKLLIYGANGYTARLKVELCQGYNLSPVLGGRNAPAIGALATNYNLPFRIFDLGSVAHIAANLKDIKAVLHCAGPFENTAKPIMEACLQAGVHYLDITGEIGVFEKAKQMDQRARERNIMIMPGVGFDVVPTDCLALALKERLPDATHLELAFASLGGGISHGTASTMVQGLGKAGAARAEGVVTPEPTGKYGQWIDFGNKKLFTISIPWGDVSTAFHTTGIPNIRVFTGAKPSAYRLLKWQWAYNWLLRTKWVKNLIQNRIDNGPAGPNVKILQESRSLIWGKVRNAKNETAEARYSVPNGYALTAHAALHIAERVLKDDWRPGYQTPAGCYGSNLVQQLENVKTLEWL
jgi:short subunit dehydrogenase-like uncharacterized protein